MLRKIRLRKKWQSVFQPRKILVIAFFKRQYFRFRLNFYVLLFFGFSSLVLLFFYINDVHSIQSNDENFWSAINAYIVATIGFILTLKWRVKVPSFTFDFVKDTKNNHIILMLTAHSGAYMSKEYELYIASKKKLHILNNNDVTETVRNDEYQYRILDSGREEVKSGIWTLIECIDFMPDDIILVHVKIGDKDIYKEMTAYDPE